MSGKHKQSCVRVGEESASDSLMYSLMGLCFFSSLLEPRGIERDIFWKVCMKEDDDDDDDDDADDDDDDEVEGTNEEKREQSRVLTIASSDKR